MKLSLLIPTIATRRHFLQRLLGVLLPQIHPDAGSMRDSWSRWTRSVLVDEWGSQHDQDGVVTRFNSSSDVELVVYEDNGEISIGEKRNACVAAAAGEYIAFIDDDDLVPDYYVTELLKAIESKPDCVGWRSKKFVDGRFTGCGIYSMRFDHYENRPLNQGETRFIRTPAHISTIRADLVRAVKFCDGDFGEDSDFAQRIRPMLKTEVFIDKVMYEYHYRSKRLRRGERVHGQRR